MSFIVKGCRRGNDILPVVAPCWRQWAAPERLLGEEESGLKVNEILYSSKRHFDAVTKTTIIIIEPSGSSVGSPDSAGPINQIGPKLWSIDCRTSESDSIFKTMFNPISTKWNENETWTHYNPAQTNQWSTKMLKCMTGYPYPKSTTSNIGLWWLYQSIQQASIVVNERNVEMRKYFTVKNLPPIRCKLMNLFLLTLCFSFFLYSSFLFIFLP